MKIDRLLGIVTILLQCRKTTAPELARRFEVSRRTIHRDIVCLCQAGIPVVTTQGSDGGIAIADGYRLGKSLFSTDELHRIMAGLRSLGSVADTGKVDALITRLDPGRDVPIPQHDRILIDLSSHYKSSLSDKIARIQSGLVDNRLLRFTYYSERGRTIRTVEPYYITYQWSAWYLFGHCRTSGGFRRFKLNRLWDCHVLGEGFVPRAVPPEAMDPDAFFSDEKEVTAWFHPSVEYRLVEEYGPDSYTKLDNGMLEATIPYTGRAYIVSWLLGFGDRATVLRPADLADEIRTQAKNILRQYEPDNPLSGLEPYAEGKTKAVPDDD